MSSTESNSPAEQVQPTSTAEPPKYRLNRKPADGTPIWDMSQERAFMETLMNQRFNFFLVFVALILNAAVNSESERYFKWILTIGCAIAALLGWTILRAHLKMNTIFMVLKKDDFHPLKFVDDQHNLRFSARWILGFGIPCMAVVILILMAIGAWFEWMPSPKMQNRNKTEELLKTQADTNAAIAQEIAKLHEELQALKVNAVSKQNFVDEIQKIKKEVAPNGVITK